MKIVLEGKTFASTHDAITTWDDGSLQIGDKYVYRPPAVMKKRAEDRKAAGLPEQEPNYYGKQDLEDICDLAIERLIKLKASLK